MYKGPGAGKSWAHSRHRQKASVARVEQAKGRECEIVRELITARLQWNLDCLLSLMGSFWRLLWLEVRVHKRPFFGPEHCSLAGEVLSLYLIPGKLLVNVAIAAVITQTLDATSSRKPSLLLLWQLQSIYDEHTNIPQCINRFAELQPLHILQDGRLCEGSTSFYICVSSVSLTLSSSF